jgi:hypothetical protein
MARSREQTGHQASKWAGRLRITCLTAWLSLAVIYISLAPASLDWSFVWRLDEVLVDHYEGEEARTSLSDWIDYMGQGNKAT